MHSEKWDLTLSIMLFSNKTNETISDNNTDNYLFENPNSQKSEAIRRGDFFERQG